MLTLYEFSVIDRLKIRTDLGLTKIQFEESELVSLKINPEDTHQNLMLVNTQYPIDSDFIADITTYRTTDVLMNTEILESYGEMSDYVRNNLGDNLYVSSTYRSFEDQQRVYEEEGPDIAAVPGTSEHQTGLAVDVYVMYFAGSAFINSETGRFLNRNCDQFGFIIRYPEGAEAITGFEYEPWHLRYVGFPHATIIMDSGITLEEYIDYFEPNEWYQYGDYLISRQSPDVLKVPAQYMNNPDDYEITISQDNTGYIFITIKTK